MKCKDSPFTYIMCQALFLRHGENKISRMLVYTSPLFVRIESWKFRIIFAMLQGIRYQSLSILEFTIRESEQFFWEVPRLLDHPVYERTWQITRNKNIELELIFAYSISKKWRPQNLANFQVFWLFSIYDNFQLNL